MLKPKLELSGYVYPPIDLLKTKDIVFSTDEVIETKSRLIHALQANCIDVSSLEATVGYTNTLYEIDSPERFTFKPGQRSAS